MTPFKDHSIVKLERPEDRTVSVTSDSTVMIDAYRQGVEVNLVNYYLKSTKAYISSKGLARSSISGRLTPELDMRDLGQQIELNNFSSFQDKSERIDSTTVLSEGLVQEDQDVYFGNNSIDGRITVFADTGKLDVATTYSKFNRRGASADASTLSCIDTFSYEANSAFRFIDGVEQMLGIPIPGYQGDEVCLNPFKEFDVINSFGMDLNYDYISNNDKTYARGFTYYGSSIGTDSIAYGGRLR